MRGNCPQCWVHCYQRAKYSRNGVCNTGVKWLWLSTDLSLKWQATTMHCYKHIWQPKICTVFVLLCFVLIKLAVFHADSSCHMVHKRDAHYVLTRISASIKMADTKSSEQTRLVWLHNRGSSSLLSWSHLSVVDCTKTLLKYSYR